MKKASVDDRVARLAAAMPKQRFVASQPHPFLVFAPAVVEDDGLNYHTTNVRASDALENAGTRGPEIVELVKSDRNRFIDRISIGRAPNCDIVVSDPSVSKLHAHVRETNGVLHLTDVGSQNGSFVNDRRIDPHVPTPLKIGDQLQFGARRAQLMDAGAVFDLLAASKNP